jgi:Tol biopolymer transport system component
VFQWVTSWAVLAAVFALALSGCGGGGEGQADLAFVSTRDGDYAIYVMNASGGDQRRLTRSDVANPATPQELFFQIEPAWSPDGSKIAFASRRTGTYDIYVMRADGSGSRTLTSGKGNDNHPTWSPDGSRIAFAHDGDIYVMDADGSEQRRISDINAEESEPAWSPDGTWLAYIRRIPGGPIKEVWAMHPDGTDRRVLTRKFEEPTNPAWSPDSRRIVFATNPDDGPYELFTIGIDGKGLRSVAPTTGDNFEPSWSPDGSKIAYQEDGAIFTVELGGGDVEKLTDQSNNDSFPTWNPKPPSGDG